MKRGLRVIHSIGYFFCDKAEPAADLLVEADRPSLKVFDALVAAAVEVFFVLLDSFWERAEPAADLLLEAVSVLLKVLDAADAAFEEVVLPDMARSFALVQRTR